MPTPLRWIVSLIYLLHIYLLMPLFGLAFLIPTLLIDRRYALSAIQTYSRYAIWSARHVLGIKCEVRGAVPEGAVIVASKHQSFLDIMMIAQALPKPRYIMKKEILRVPALGWYAVQIGCVPVDRGKGGTTVAQMLSDVAAGEGAGQLVIYPQGTRVPPGVSAPYKRGTGALYTTMDVPCVPVACHVGHVWPRSGVMRRAGTAVVEFLEPIPAGLSEQDFLEQMSERVEAASEALRLADQSGSNR